MLQVVLAAAAVMATVYWAGFVGRAGWPWGGTWIKALSVAFLAIGGAMMGTPVWIVAGLALGAVGDFALSRPAEKAFLAGMGAFALGHLAYAVQFWGLVAFGATGGLQMAALAGLGLLVLSTEVWLAPHAGALRWPVRGYGLIIGGMAAMAVLVPSLDGRGLLWAGVGFFVASDFLLALRVFRVKEGSGAAVLSHLVWPAYWLGQALILLGASVLWSVKA